MVTIHLYKKVYYKKYHTKLMTVGIIDTNGHVTPYLRYAHSSTQPGRREATRIFLPAFD